MIRTGAELQDAINSAQSGDTIIVEAGVIYARDLTLPVKSGTGYVTIQSSRASELPEGKRVSPAQEALFAKLQSIDQGEPVIKTAAGAHHYRLIGLEISAPSPTHVLYDLVRIGDDKQTDYAQVPHNFIIDRTWIHGFAAQDLQRGISLNGTNVTISNSYISDIHGKGYDTQAICCWNGPGPFKIINNYLEGAGENVMFGGAWAAITGLVPTDIEVRGNHFRKPLSWYVNDPSYAGIHWTVKNLFELKNARKVVVQGNLFEGNWTDAQAGRAIAFTPRPSDSGPGTVIEDVDFSYNIIRNIGSGVILLGRDEPPAPTDTRLRRVRIAHNVFEIDGPRFDSNGAFLTIINGAEDITIEHNTALHTGPVILADYAPNSRVAYRNNITRHNEYGIFGSGVGMGNPAIAHYFLDSTITGNVIAKEVNAPWNVESIYPAGNFYPNSLAEVLGAEYRVLPAWKGKATDGTDPGVDVDALLAAQGGSIPAPPPAPTPTPTPTPEPTPNPPSPTPPQPSPDGTKGTSIIDSEGATWTIGPQFQTLRNGVQASGGSGTEYKYLARVVYVKGDPQATEHNWYKWLNPGWESVGLQEPGTTPVPTPTPTPTPTPIPTPQPCRIFAPESVSIPRNGSGSIEVRLENLTGPTEVRVASGSSDGQVTITPLLWTIDPANPSKQFTVRAKNKRQVRVITFSSPCGNVSVKVNVT